VSRSKKQLQQEVDQLRERVAELEALEEKAERAEESLKDAEKRSRAWLEHSPVCTKIVDLDFNLQYMSKAGIAGLGIGDITAFYGKPYPFDFYPESFKNVMGRNLERAKKAGEVIAQEASVFDTEGNELWFHSTLVPVNDDEGRIAYIMIVSVNTTERNQAEKALRESEEKFRSLVESGSNLTLLADAQGSVTYASPQCEEVLGHTGEEIIGQTFPDIIHPDDVPMCQHAWEQVATLGCEIDELEYRIINGQGALRWISHTARLVVLDDVVIGLHSTIRSITERKQGEEALRGSEEQFRTLVEQSTSAIEIYTPDGRMLMANDAWARLWNLKKEDVADYNILDDPQCEITGLTPAFREAQQGRSQDIQETRYDPDDSGFVDGRARWIAARMYPIKDSAGEVRNIVLTYDDITARKQAEEDTAELQEQLQQSQKMEAIGRLAGGVAHDFNNLLTVILGNSDMMAADLREGDPLLDSLTEITKATNRATALTRQLLAFSRKQVLQPGVIDLNTIVKDIDKMLRRLIGEDIELASILGPELGRVLADPGQIEQVLMNLAVNARDAMPEGGKLTIETGNVELDESYANSHPDVQPGPHVMLAVSDSGYGMDEQTRKMIFEPFFTTKKKGKGTGLGLSTVHGIVKQSGGNILAYSEPGRGATFKVYLRRVEDTVTAPKTKDFVGALHGTETVLVVEDDEAVRALAVSILRRCGYTVLKAGDGEEAQYVSEKHPDRIHLVLTDVVMPGASGNKVARSLTAHRPEIKVLYMSGYTDNAIARHGVLEDGAKFIEKPFTPTNLSMKVREVLDT
jgi:PAS domain S-box-containing protein